MHDFPTIAQVVVELPIRTPLAYRIPPALRPRCQVGQRVLVPLGERQVLGYIVGLASTSMVAKLKDVVGVLDDTPLLTPALLQLTRWVAEYYLCAWGQVLKVAVPEGFRVQSRVVYALTPKAVAHPQAWPQGRAGDMLHALAEHGAQCREDLGHKVGIAHPGPLLRRLHQQGLISIQPQRLPPRTRPYLVTIVRLGITSAAAHDLQTRLRRRAPIQAALLELFQNQSEWELAALRRRIPGATAAVKRLVQRAVVELVQREQLRSVVPPVADPGAPIPELNQAQYNALRQIEAKLAAPDGVPILIHGVTGSGKTEVYMRAIASVLRQGKSALVLVPEIALTTQLIERFAGRFSLPIAVLHSGLSSGERFDAWRRLASGDARLAIGARSAVFAPLPSLGLIIVDEEHEAAYKQEETPRYNARDVAIVRAQQGHAVVILGSATPSLESFYHAKQGKYLLLCLPHRVEQRPLPHVTIVDQRGRAATGERVISSALSQAIATRLQRHEQCLILINRRGFASYLQCHDCGVVLQCRRCSVSLTYHQHGRRLKCHYCDFSQPAPSICPQCHGSALHPFGIGTQQVEGALKTLFPGARLGRMDRDTMRSKAAYWRILQRLRRGELDLLVGTQMIAKGHDYPNITLVGVVSADAALAVPDFRAPERLFQLLTQVAGRTGRGAVPGEGFIQTYRPDHPSIDFARNHDFLGFFSDEIQRRRALLYPPFARLARLVLESRSPERVARASQRVRDVFQECLSDTRRLVVLGPAEAPVAKIRDRYRWHLLLKAVSSRLLHHWLDTALAAINREPQQVRGVRLSIDIDPLTFV